MKTTLIHKKKSLLKWMGIFAAFLVLHSCEKDGNTLEENPNMSTKEDIAMIKKSTFATNQADEDLNLVMGIELNANYKAQSSLCAVKTWNTGTHTLTIDFGTGCTGPHGKERSGKIIVVFNGPVGAYTTDKTITFDNYVVNNVEVSGMIEVQKFTENPNGFLENSYTLVAYAHTYPNGDKITLNGTRAREWIEGVGDHEISNNVFRLTGGISGVSTTGRSFTHNILEPVISDFNCRANGGFLRVDGIKEMFFDGLVKDSEKKVDYGDGSCDNSFTITINGKQFTISMN